MRWEDEERNAELSNLCDDLWTVETIPIYRIKDACDCFGFPIDEFIEQWEVLDMACDLINRAERK